MVGWWVGGLKDGGDIVSVWMIERISMQVNKPRSKIINEIRNQKERNKER